MVEVSAGIVISKGKILCMQKGIAKYPYLSNKYEFPGGKIEKGESAKQTIIRELSEELHTDISNSRIEEYIVVNYDYPDFSVKLNNFLIYSDDFCFELTEHRSFQWCSPEELKTLDWTAADAVIANILINDLCTGRVKAA